MVVSETTLIAATFRPGASADTKERFEVRRSPAATAITQWLDSFSIRNRMSDEAAAFMYMQLGLDEMGLWVE